MPKKTKQMAAGKTPFRVKAGTAKVQGIVYRKGQIVYSDKDLMLLFKNKFERVHSDEMGGIPPSGETPAGAPVPDTAPESAGGLDVSVSKAAAPPNPEDDELPMDKFVKAKSVGLTVELQEDDTYTIKDEDGDTVATELTEEDAVEFVEKAIKRAEKASEKKKRKK